MRAGIFIALFVSAAMVTTSAPVAAFHGTPYSLGGEACLAVVMCFPATLSWSGSFGINGGQFALRISAPGFPQQFTGGVISGREDVPATFTGAATCTSLEVVVPYVGTDLQTGGRTFRIQGHQDNCLGGLRAGERFMDVDGKYQTIWDLHMSVGTPF